MALDHLPVVIREMVATNVVPAPVDSDDYKNIINARFSVCAVTGVRKQQLASQIQLFKCLKGKTRIPESLWSALASYGPQAPWDALRYSRAYQYHLRANLIPPASLPTAQSRQANAAQLPHEGQPRQRQPSTINSSVIPPGIAAQEQGLEEQVPSTPTLLQRMVPQHHGVNSTPAATEAKQPRGADGQPTQPHQPRSTISINSVINHLRQICTEDKKNELERIYAEMKAVSKSGSQKKEMLQAIQKVVGRQALIQAVEKCLPQASSAQRKRPAEQPTAVAGTAGSVGMGAPVMQQQLGGGSAGMFEVKPPLAHQEEVHQEAPLQHQGTPAVMATACEPGANTMPMQPAQALTVVPVQVEVGGRASAAHQSGGGDGHPTQQRQSGIRISKVIHGLREIVDRDKRQDLESLYQSYKAVKHSGVPKEEILASIQDVVGKEVYEMCVHKGDCIRQPKKRPREQPAAGSSPTAGKGLCGPISPGIGAQHQGAAASGHDSILKRRRIMAPQHHGSSNTTPGAAVLETGLPVTSESAVVPYLGAGSLNVATTEQDKTLCICCMESQREIAVFPCSHFVLCEACSKHSAMVSKPCIICRKPIEEIRKVFLS
ncbi:hypothetical protein CYMTET_54129 [Cymbomonas tetramitiformis]|uniref:RING-type domain-containing protein n=1 Tax=Cymbomonas tetramitiformis TaxID=36881 RepID=A0AAE0EP18_9CHLO|nr:hypothetical protein CYMTET_54129 [Cymbomonas tetramitiformis]